MSREQIIPEAGARWRHNSGAFYNVLEVANTNADEERRDEYPVLIVYMGDDGRVWARTLEKWLGSMVYIESENN